MEFGLSECNRVKVNRYTSMFMFFSQFFNPIALRKAKIAYNFGLSECNRVKRIQLLWFSIGFLNEELLLMRKELLPLGASYFPLKNDPYREGQRVARAFFFKEIWYADFICHQLDAAGFSWPGCSKLTMFYFFLFLCTLLDILRPTC